MVIVAVWSGNGVELFNPLNLIGLINWLFLIFMLVVPLLCIPSKEQRDKADEELEEGKRLYKKFKQTGLYEDSHKFLEWYSKVNTGTRNMFDRWAKYN